MQHLTCWIGLDDSTRENGCLQYIPKSHTWDLLPITGLAGDMAAIKKVLNDPAGAKRAFIYNEIFGTPVGLRKQGKIAPLWEL